MWLLLVLVVAVPLAIMPVVNAVTVRSWWDWHNSWLGLVLAFGLTGTITNIIKITSGRPRPDMLARCLPRPDSANAAVFGLVDSSICTQTDENIMKDAFRSFVSGHSSLAFSGLGFLTFYLSGKMHLFDRRGHALKSWISLTPLVGATLIGISRTMDYRHHWQDVLIGGLLGLTLAYFCYRQYYPSLEHPLCHRPYSPRVKRPHPVEHEMGDRSPATAVDVRDTQARTHESRQDEANDSDDDNTLDRQEPDLSEMWRDDHGTRSHTGNVGPHAV
ncbi:hypothetical protein FRC02_002758 [Tulasnella sp. 418]|nr:hypothetical protein FRC02_002758 [Tulasnella sp. 418]